ncbi:lipid A phosphoethanolamine transferase [Erwinia sp. OLTSP20]|uniref:kdo(2)-lipid A phosphoethanolamine 7''-transferase n=1 Tax=unclassified Erwinia TaxID=2622719 RepID=UPI000C19B173|nr:MULTISPECIES: kdo(2)-lipid A phosphoethanolamine 7''-transferase [unclassified Erwinia]PIJ50732.1 lipid A phosphoethanolamine transferase [Erwinia sp. OAMSP11]PIJ75401.1 lipid A phosphoethanolamine transferase [Erwinia sp. OLSSP12]PIJ81899.1 lipid A phosphoethanolamine transferase [Erwinia sp. OLCASP19]PIJ84554.1 lipid A phosphoethanolamine transferase [Erwinia sp. OLMTSP26]PIJ86901.1 lipid A phosphoethanolamine transferase [Erwinia sp. OLMDSP33]
MNYIKSLTQQKLSVFLALYIGLLLNLPIFYRRFEPMLSHFSFTKLLSAVVEVSAVVLLTFALMRVISLGGKLVYRILATILVLVSVASSFYMTFFNVVIGYGIVASVLAKDDLSGEVIGYHFYIWMVLVSALPLVMIWSNHLRLTLLEQIRTRGQRWRPLLVLVLAVGLVWLPIRYLDMHQSSQETLTNVDLPSYGGVVAHSYLPSNWLAATGLFAYTRLDEALNSHELPDPAKKFTYQAPAGLDNSYVVFVIGETTRWDHMGMLGYPRDTTPELSKEPNLVAFKGQSCDTATKLSLRCMFVREGGTDDNPGRTLKKQNVFSVLKKLGFSSELFAMQSEVWFYNNADTDSYAFREQIGSEKRNQGKPVDDMLLVPELKDSIERHPGGKHLVILHTKGSHYLYSRRYPRSFARYQPECAGVDDVCSKEQLINAYDNSVLYVDTMLDSVIDQLRDKKAIVFYAADHGESISDNMHLHGTPRNMAPPEQFRVPMIVWVSDSWLADGNNKAAFERLKTQQQAGVTHRHVELFDTIMGCLGYTSPDGGINQKNNWCAAAPGSQPKPSARQL